MFLFRRSLGLLQSQGKFGIVIFLKIMLDSYVSLPETTTLSFKKWAFILKRRPQVYIVLKINPLVALPKLYRIQEQP